MVPEEVAREPLAPEANWSVGVEPEAVATGWLRASTALVDERTRCVDGCSSRLARNLIVDSSAMPPVIVDERTPESRPPVAASGVNDPLRQVLQVSFDDNDVAVVVVKSPVECVQTVSFVATFWACLLCNANK